MADLGPQAHLRKGNTRVKQRVIRRWASMMAMRTGVKSGIHDLIDSQLLPPDVLKAKPINLFSKKGVKWLTSLEWAKEEDKKIVESHLRVMEAINHEISITNNMVETGIPEGQGCPAACHYSGHRCNPSNAYQHLNRRHRAFFFCF